ncbi:MAG: hypothetical protein QNK23_06330 [Crocinitomicaceae bacterium]|nr:hypothetical protein [Crocinitomicaceae bacterium]
MFHQSGARKKKRLTDPVRIIPFPEQNLRDKVKKTAAPKPAIKKTAENFFVKEPPKVMTAPSGTLNTSSISIKKMMEKKEEEGEQHLDLSNMPRNPYSTDDLKMAWRKFAFIMKNERKETIYNAMIKRDPKRVDEDDYIMEVDNQTQIDMIQGRFSDLLGYVRKTLQNYDITIRMEITKNPDEEVKFQTGKDKFAALARKNPNLHTLKNTFNLDIEF